MINSNRERSTKFIPSNCDNFPYDSVNDGGHKLHSIHGRMKYSLPRGKLRCDPASNRKHVRFLRLPTEYRNPQIRERQGTPLKPQPISYEQLSRRMHNTSKEFTFLQAQELSRGNTRSGPRLG